MQETTGCVEGSKVWYLKICRLTDKQISLLQVPDSRFIINFYLYTQGQNQPGSAVPHRERGADKVEEPLVVRPDRMQAQWQTGKYCEPSAPVAGAPSSNFLQFFSDSFKNISPFVIIHSYSTLATHPWGKNLIGKIYLVITLKCIKTALCKILIVV
jgi:hypothetical protein